MTSERRAVAWETRPDEPIGLQPDQAVNDDRVGPRPLPGRAPSWRTRWPALAIGLGVALTVAWIALLLSATAAVIVHLFD